MFGFSLGKGASTLRSRSTPGCRVSFPLFCICLRFRFFLVFADFLNLKFLLLFIFKSCRCIPYRYKSGSEDELEFLVISSKKGQGMMFPKVATIYHCRDLYKINNFNFFIHNSSFQSPSNWNNNHIGIDQGGWETDESVEEAAARESLEEAGVLGKVGRELGQWSFMSKRYGTFYEGYMYPLLVKEQLELWPEKNERRRVWVSHLPMPGSLFLFG